MKPDLLTKQCPSSCLAVTEALRKTELPQRIVLNISWKLCHFLLTKYSIYCMLIYNIIIYNIYHHLTGAPSAPPLLRWPPVLQYIYNRPQRNLRKCYSLSRGVSWPSSSLVTDLQLQQQFPHLSLKCHSNHPISVDMCCRLYVLHAMFFPHTTNAVFHKVEKQITAKYQKVTNSKYSSR